MAIAVRWGWIRVPWQARKSGQEDRLSGTVLALAVSGPVAVVAKVGLGAFARRSSFPAASLRRA
jgi:hypothetical protein